MNSALYIENRNKINNYLYDIVDSNNSKINNELLYLFKNGGKRIRPLCCLLTCQICGYHNKDAISLAVLPELIHTASLIHDDLIDNSDKRRNQLSINYKYNNKLSGTIGDWLFAKVFLLSTKFNNFAISEEIMLVTKKMAEGELQQLQNKKNSSLSIENYITAIKAKTAVLFETSFKLGALLSTKDQEKIDKLTKFGLYLGVAFQISDDILDYFADPTKLGKNVGDDFNNQKITLPLIYYLKEINISSKNLKSFFKKNNFLDTLENMRKNNILQKSQDIMGQHIDKAILQLEIFPESEYKNLLVGIAENISVRKF